MNAPSKQSFPSPAFIGGAFLWSLVGFLSLGLCAAGGCAGMGMVNPEPTAWADGSGGGRVMISPEELSALMDDPALVLVHVGHGDKGYQRGHIPRAIYVDFDEVYVNRALAMELPADDAMVALVRRLGIDEASKIVLIGDASGVFPARLYVTLARLGLAGQMRLLDGQVKGWVERGFALSQELPETPEPSGWEPTLNRWVIATADDVEDALAGVYDAMVVDVRPATQFSGEKTGPGVRAKGRIEGAVNLPWMSLLAGTNPPWLRSEAELRQRLSVARLSATTASGEKQRVIVYDSSGIHASWAFVVLTDLGFEVSLYDGAFEEWSQRSAE